jgi:hypothetical protein
MEDYHSVTHCACISLPICLLMQGKHMPWCATLTEVWCPKKNACGCSKLVAQQSCSHSVYDACVYWLCTVTFYLSYDWYSTAVEIQNRWLYRVTLCSSAMPLPDSMVFASRTAGDHSACRAKMRCVLIKEYSKSYRLNWSAIAAQRTVSACWSQRPAYHSHCVTI